MTGNEQFNTQFNAQNNTQSTYGTQGGAQIAAGRRMIYRHPTDHSLGGVCAGVADFLNVDPVIVRGLWVVATFMSSGAGLFVYLLLWLLLPVGMQATGQMRPAAIQFNRMGGSRLATALLILGGLWLLSNLGILPALAGVAGGFLRIFFWPLLLIGIGYMLLKGRDNALRMHFGDMRTEGATATVRARIPFRRSRSDRMVLGVCGGLSDKLNLDANLIRLGWAVLTLASLGLGVFVYLGMALLVPEEGSHYSPDLETVARNNGHMATGRDMHDTHNTRDTYDTQEMQDVPIAQAVRTQSAPAAPAGVAATPIDGTIVHF